MSDTALIRRDILELTQKFQSLFPCDVDQEVVQDWIGSKGPTITNHLRWMFGSKPSALRLIGRNTGLLQRVDEGRGWYLDSKSTFSAKSFFVLGKIVSTEEKIGLISPRFACKFLMGGGKTENPLIRVKRTHSDLLRVPDSGATFRSVEGEIIREIGHDCLAETTLVEVWNLLLNYSLPKLSDELLDNGSGNVFFIRDQEGNLCLVLLWKDATENHWCLDAFDLHSSRQYSVAWQPGWRVFHR